jgi:hypothetical protein
MIVCAVQAAETREYLIGFEKMRYKFLNCSLFEVKESSYFVLKEERFGS